jgi:hypothetical protein
VTDRRTVHRRLIRSEAMEAATFTHLPADSKGVDHFAWVVFGWLCGVVSGVIFAMVGKAPLRGFDDDLVAIGPP